MIAPSSDGREVQIVGSRTDSPASSSDKCFPIHFYASPVTRAYSVETMDSSMAKLEKTTLSGGSLGSCVDEERSQLRELM